MELHNTLEQPSRIAILLQRGTLQFSDVATAVQHSNLPIGTDKRKLNSLELTLGHTFQSVLGYGAYILVSLPAS